MDWQTTYPTLATVMEAGIQTLTTWEERLPAPQTDVERTVHRRIGARRCDLERAAIRAKAPEFADKFNEIIDKMEALGIPNPLGGRY